MPTYNEKYCVSCQQVKNREQDFYKAGSYVQTRCKPCHNQYRKAVVSYTTNRKQRPPSKTFDSLSNEKQQDILTDLKTMRLLPVSKKNNVSYALMRQWKKGGLFDNILKQFKPPVKERPVKWGFSQLEPHLKKQILEDIKIKSLNKVAEENNIPTRVIYGWRDKGKFNNIQLFSE